MSDNVVNVIDNIHSKFDQLKVNLTNFENKIDLTLKELPSGDLRS